MASTYTVEIQHQGTTQTISAAEDQTLLEAALAAGIDLPRSCCAGVCTTCAARIHAGTVEQPDAMGLGPEIMEQGYALLCVAYPRSDLQIESEQEDVVYHLQFGQFQ
ncbi:2Fe-2S iron-sulfur cluster-binding protein [Lyngbya confervoides]|uniref:2Fe-2S iron-sulfur cluster-binding protein n=1 Tax=Lyngbya confervoides BDU141951 TaxID=1574623 RepID=A0ABD4T2D1_9CYAN|nr:2Fe-2S iron-sulfur cluster-binding protein [Lyngbya confervoides]MCM1982745.1 2Fe-2S iron-sulfur cluster-binding protein [Lyngbya confervoides BDU141951]